MAGECPHGWHRYDAASGRYIVAADGRDIEAGTMGQASGTVFEYRDADHHGRGEIIISAPQRKPFTQGGMHTSVSSASPDSPSSYIALNLCQRR
jgi:hypothetical protein